MICLVAQQQKAIARPEVKRLCKTLSIGRSSYYRGRGGRPDPDLALRDQIHKLALSWPSYGYRPMTRALKRLGYHVNHKRVLRLMREDNLLALRRRAFVSTIDSNHDRAVYANLLPELNVTGVNQLWVADLTYIRLAREWVYLAVVLDAFSRRCIGWALDRNLEASLTLDALNSALVARPTPEGLVHHSDQGVQYASKAYVEALKKEGISISMSRRGNPYDNAQVERFIRTLKYEEVYLFEYESLEEARSRIGYFIDQLYNRKRLHSALEGLRTERIRRAFSDKFPKLAKCTAEGTRTVLILESQDAAHTRFDLVGALLPALLAEQTYLPDEIFLVESNMRLWWVYPMKYDKDHWPEVGMPQWNGPIYHPDNPPTAGAYPSGTLMRFCWTK